MQELSFCSNFHSRARQIGTDYFPTQVAKNTMRTGKKQKSKQQRPEQPASEAQVRDRSLLSFQDLSKTWFMADCTATLGIVISKFSSERLLIMLRPAW